MKKILIPVASLLAAAVLGLPWVLGRQAERFYQGTLEMLPAQGIEVVESRYDRGWFGAEALTVLALAPSLTPPGEEAPRLRIASHIGHGPWRLDAPRPRPVSALVESRIEPLLPDLPGLQVTILVELDGSGITALKLPALQVPAVPSGDGSGFTMAEGRGELQFRPDLASSRVWFELPSLALEVEEGGEIELGGLRLEGDSRRWIGGLFMGKGSLTLERLALRGPDVDFAAQGLAMTVETIPDGELFTLRSEYRATGVEAEGERYGPAVVAISFSHIPGEGIASLQQSLRELAAQPQTAALPDIAAGALVAEHLPRFLAADPAMALERLEVTTPQGRVAGHLSLAVRGLTPEVMQEPGVWFAHLVGDGELSLPLSLLTGALTSWQQQQALAVLHRGEGEGEGEDATLPGGREGRFAEAAREQIDALVREGWVTEQDGRITTQVKLAGGLLTVNGKSIPLGNP